MLLARGSFAFTKSGKDLEILIRKVTVLTLNSIPMLAPEMVVGPQVTRSSRHVVVGMLIA
jgi:hypothetical protein